MKVCHNCDPKCVHPNDRKYLKKNWSNRRKREILIALTSLWLIWSNCESNLHEKHQPFNSYLVLKDANKVNKPLLLPIIRKKWENISASAQTHKKNSELRFVHKLYCDVYQCVWTVIYYCIWFCGPVFMLSESKKENKRHGACECVCVCANMNVLTYIYHSLLNHTHKYITI